MLNKRSILFLLLCLGIIIAFDAFQQKYYVDRFNLGEEPIPLLMFLRSHLIRWSIWLLTALPFGMIIRRSFILKPNKVNTQLVLKIVMLIIPFLVLAILLISFSTLIQYNRSFSAIEFQDHLLFIFYQKGITFFMAYGATVLWIFLSAQAKELEAQWLEIKDLRQSSKNGLEPHLTVKLGSRVKTLSIKEIVWIQADDYCVRIHTKDQSYYLRKTLKFLENELSPFRFVRIHRGALLNLQYLDHIDFNALTIRLQNEKELPLSKSGVQMLKQKIKDETL